METAVTKLTAVSSANSPTLSKAQEEFAKQYDALPTKRMEELILSQSLALHQVDRTALTLCVASSIGDYLNFVGLGRKMNDKQIYETAELIIESHPHLPIEAIKTFIHECKKGVYGYHYDEMNGTRILMWLDKFVQDYYRQIDDYEYSKHESTKGEHATPIQTEDGEQPIDYDTFLARHRPDEKERMDRNEKIKDIRLSVYKANKHLFNTMSVEEADKVIEEKIIEEMRKQNLLTF